SNQNRPMMTGASSECPPRAGSPQQAKPMRVEMTKTWQETEARNADDIRNVDDARNVDNRGVIAGRIVERSRVANDQLGSLVLASLMSTAPVYKCDCGEDAEH